MTVYEYLEQVKNLDNAINEKLALKEHIWALATKVSSSLDGVSAGGGVSDKVGNGVVRLREWAAEVDALIDTYIDRKQEVIESLGKLSDDKQASVLYRYYVVGETWEEIAANMGYTYVHVWRIKKAAIENMRNILEM